MINRTELSKESLLKYNSYSDEWLRDYFNRDNGIWSLTGSELNKAREANRKKKNTTRNTTCV